MLKNAATGLAMLGCALFASMAQAQSSGPMAVERAKAEFARTMEALLTEGTHKTTVLTFLRTYDVGEGSYMCGEAYFGSSKKRFLMAMPGGKFIIDPPTQLWDEMDCEDPRGGLTVVDTR